MKRKFLIRLSAIGAGFGLIACGDLLNDTGQDLPFYLGIVGIIVIAATVLFLFLAPSRRTPAASPAQDGHRDLASLSPAKGGHGGSKGGARTRLPATEVQEPSPGANTDTGPSETAPALPPGEAGQVELAPAVQPEGGAGKERSEAPSPAAAVHEEPVAAGAVAALQEEADVHQAAAEGDLARVKTLIQGDPALVSLKNASGLTPLHSAVSRGRQEVAEFLVARGADVRARDNNGWTPLHWAAIHGHMGVAEWLLANQADVNAKESNGWTPLHWAAGKGRKEVAELLRLHGGRE